MNESTGPVLPGARIIRTYPNDYAGSDVDSEMESQFEEDSEDEEQFSVAERLVQNQGSLDSQINSWVLEKTRWSTSDGSSVVLIKKPTASHLSHKVLNPFIYRNIRNAGSFNDLATLLETPNEWESRYNQVIEDGYILEYLDLFRRNPEDTLESIIQSGFIGLVSQIAMKLGLQILSGSKARFIVGGILSRYIYDVRSKSDPFFLSKRGVPLIASEIETPHTFRPGEMWYHKSRGIQTLTTLYNFNCPTFLLTQSHWKLFVENKDRTAVLTFPYNDNVNHTPHVNSSLIYETGTTLIKAIVICLLSNRGSIAETEPTIPQQAQNLETPRKVMVQEKLFDSAEKPSRKSERLMKSSGSNNGKKQPTFISGYKDGKPIYSVVRVLPQEEVQRIEEEIAMEEKAGLMQQSSELTLF